MRLITRKTAASVLGIIGSLLVSITAAQGQSNPALERLSPFVGTWAYSQVYDTSALFPSGGHNKGRRISQWDPVACHSSSRSMFRAPSTAGLAWRS